MPTPSDTTVEAWTAMVSASRRVLERVEGALKAAGLPPLSWYDALLEIERAGKPGIRPFALRERLLLPQYGTSRLIDRIERDGLIEKLACDDDGRGFLVRITAEGRRVRRRMWPVYGKVLAEGFENTASAEQLETLARLCRRIASAG
ncbi:MAG: MarR family winged helix-turn-helix transcriptional regulator [Gammaproteobacteria bacterium]|nr:MarR family winged helix-turn-helix transcriptional regulator [Gammaproteobacteria bacterium]